MKLSQAIIDLRYDEIKTLVQDELKSGKRAIDVLNELREGLDEVGKRYESQEYFLTELHMAAVTMKQALEVLKPHIESRDMKARGKVLMASIVGDIHDFGKSIVVALLVANGFEVHDLGVDVSPEEFAKKARELGADVVGISALLSTTQPTSAKVVEELEKIGLRDRVKVILGGAGVQGSAVERYGVDCAVDDGVEGLEIIKSWLGSSRIEA